MKKTKSMDKQEFPQILKKLEDPNEIKMALEKLKKMIEAEQKKP